MSYWDTYNEHKNEKNPHRINPFKLNGISHFNKWDQSISI